MVKFAADQNFDHNILRGLMRLRPDVDIVTAQDSGLSRAEDPDLLEWAASEGRIVLTHDVNTMTAFAYQRVAAGLKMPGVICAGHTVTIGQAIDDLVLITDLSVEGEWEGKVEYLPL